MMRLLLLGLVCGALGVVFGAITAAIASAQSRRRHRARALAGRPSLEWTSRAKFPVWRCTSCGLAFLANGVLIAMRPRECPNPRCRVPWVWSWPGDEQVHHDPDDDGGPRAA